MMHVVEQRSTGASWQGIADRVAATLAGEAVAETVFLAGAAQSTQRGWQTRSPCCLKISSRACHLDPTCDPKGRGQRNGQARHVAA
ncbi:MAG TPA: hypothetical protein VJ928_04570 [Marivita sp.]|nr:hypothetical protein [Marivita sp.]